MTVLGVIPARLDSERLPRKVLLPVGGLPMVVRTYRQVCGCFDEAVVATDSAEVAACCREYSVPVAITPPCGSGTERVALVARDARHGFVVNVQADEPLITPEHVRCLLCTDRPVATLRCPLSEGDCRAADPNCVKVVCSRDGRALYFSRSRVPSAGRCWKHIGVYAYRPHALREFCAWQPTPLELTERLEQLRFLENGVGIHVADAPADTIGVDTAEDLERVRGLLG